MEDLRISQETQVQGQTVRGIGRVDITSPFRQLTREASRRSSQ